MPSQSQWDMLASEWAKALTPSPDSSTPRSPSVTPSPMPWLVGFSQVQTVSLLQLLAQLTGSSPRQVAESVRSLMDYDQPE